MADHAHVWEDVRPEDGHIEVVMQSTLSPGMKSVFVIVERCSVKHCYIGRTGDEIEFDIREGIRFDEGIKIETTSLFRGSKESE